MRTYQALLPALLLAACSTGTDPVFGTDPDLAAELPEQVDGREDLALLDDRGQPDATVDIMSVDQPLVPDVFAETVGPQCNPGEGCFLDPCQENGDCQSGWCVQHLGERVCSQNCQEECPPGWSCQQVAGTDPDVVYICVSAYANLCRPCHTNADCTSTGGVADACLDYGPGGNFCGAPCGEDGACPWGFSCGEAVTVEGTVLQQCLNDTGECPCAETAVALGLTTACSVSNEFGICTGNRMCTEEGLTECDAATPEAESCDGLDNDCDGETDEPGLVEGQYVSLCDDGNECTADTCQGGDGCAFEVLSEGECKDGDPCTVADHCQDGTCVGNPVVCDDGNPCTDDSCDEAGGCTFVNNMADCDDGDPCTVGDECLDGECSGVAIPCQCQEDADCAVLEDGNLCNGTLVCDTEAWPTVCIVDPDTIVVCPEPPAGPDSICLAAACDPDTGSCSLVPDHEGFACDDGDACTIGDACVEGLCEPGGAAACVDNNPCTDDLCDAENGCLFVANQEPCNDGNLCTLDDQCTEGQCQGGAPLDCDDDNPCTSDSCAPGQGCLHLLNEAPCDDDDVCTTGDHCHLGECISSGALTCNDNNICTDDSCDPIAGCAFQPNNAACDDGNLCTDGDECESGWCKAGSPLDCDDGNPCTDDGCDPATGCTHAANADPCDDGNACTTGEACADTLCGGGQPLACDDGNPCTDDSCDPAQGCLFVPNVLPCDDDDACTLGDLCDNGQCLGTEVLSCDDDNACTDDFCDAESGCVHVPLDGVPCTDNSICTEDDQCVTGVCQPGAALVCDDGDLCTDDSCDPESGCIYQPITPCCGNGIVEEGEQCDDGNLVDGDGCSSICSLATNLVPGNTQIVAVRQGFRAQCKDWSGDVCLEMWVTIPMAAVTQLANCGIDDTTSLRPVWHGDVNEQCKTVCWIATGNSTCLEANTSGKDGTHTGWMYGNVNGYAVGCDNDGRQYSQVQVPTVGPQVWSFDRMDWERSGHFSSYRCNW